MNRAALYTPFYAQQLAEWRLEDEARRAAARIARKLRAEPPPAPEPLFPRHGNSPKRKEVAHGR